MYEDCSCVQGIEHFIDPRPYLPQYGSPDQYTIQVPNWMRVEGEDVDGVVTTTTNDASSTETAELKSKDQRTAFLKVTGNVIINSGYVYMVAYQIRSSYFYVTSDDDVWKNGNVSLIVQHLDDDKQVVIPVELDKYITIPDEILTPGVIRVSATCMAKGSNREYSSILTEGVDIRVNDPGIKQVDWPTKPAYDIYYNYQVTANNINKGITSLNNNIAGLEYDVINLKEENMSLKSIIEDLKIRINRLEEQESI